ncbi:MAG: hypothetical protein QF637_13255 [Acidimicrobiales bacterium]|nr:hypothetical protein [Acidimicrobiales bacterium]
MTLPAYNLRISGNVAGSTRQQLLYQAAVNLLPALADSRVGVAYDVSGNSWR